MAAAVRYSQMILGANATGGVIAVPGASVHIRRNGATATVYANRTKTPVANPLPIGVSAGAAGVDVHGNLVVWLEPDYRYDAEITSGSSTTIVVFPTITPDVTDTVTPNPAVSNVVYDSAGRFQSATEDGIALSVTRDSTGRIATFTAGTTTRSIVRDSAGRVTGVA